MARKYTAHVVSHTHWDREWYKTFQHYRMRLVDLTDTLIDLLEAKGAQVAYHDPHIPVIPPTREHAAFTGRQSVEPGPGFDCMLLATAHRTYTAEALLGHGVPVVDTRNVLPRGPLVFPA